MSIIHFLVFTALAVGLVALGYFLRGCGGGPTPPSGSPKVEINIGPVSEQADTKTKAMKGKKC